jgi:hypothetical protein
MMGWTHVPHGSGFSVLWSMLLMPQADQQKSDKDSMAVHGDHGCSDR